jgi:hypothetical protein
LSDRNAVIDQRELLIGHADDDGRGSGIRVSQADDPKSRANGSEEIAQIHGASKSHGRASRGEENTPAPLRSFAESITQFSGGRGKLSLLKTASKLEIHLQI